MKPIVRWTIGDVSSEGLLCLESSVVNFINLYKKKFDYYICYNNIEINNLEFIKKNKYEINVVNQHQFLNEIHYDLNSPNEPFWKLIPPRINAQSHEIFIDNDLILYKKLKEIDYFLNNNDLIICSEALIKNYGFLNEEINDLEIFNSGFFGIYPFFDLKNKINETIKKFNLNEKKDVFNEQGCIAYVFKNEKLKIINKKKISICFDDINFGENGIHFVGINRLDNGVYYEQMPFLENRIKFIKKINSKQKFL